MLRRRRETSRPSSSRAMFLPAAVCHQQMPRAKTGRRKRTHDHGISNHRTDKSQQSRRLKASDRKDPVLVGDDFLDASEAHFCEVVSPRRDRSIGRPASLSPCNPPPTPNKTPLAIIWLMLLPVAPTTAPTRAIQAPAIMKYRRPKMSLSAVLEALPSTRASYSCTYLNRPPTVTMTLAARFHDTLIQV